MLINKLLTATAVVLVAGMALPANASVQTTSSPDHAVVPAPLQSAVARNDSRDRGVTGTGNKDGTFCVAVVQFTVMEVAMATLPIQYPVASMICPTANELAPFHRTLAQAGV